MRKQVLAICGALSICGSANAAFVTKQIDFAATFKSGSPYTAVSGQFVVRFDADATYTNSPVVTVNSFTLPGLSFPVGFSKSGNNLIFGGNDPTRGVAGISPVANDFLFFFFDYTLPAPTSSGLTYSVGSELFASFNGGTFTATVTDKTPAVPEPATWAMFIGGFGLMGAAMRRRQRVTVRYA